ncbi:7-cyano-7-deazaguanine synthase [hydrothermal vent metagenome]|uniref:7-cyano-7-deazaguanine synthase n=1 Tax=hydrothermal vent metagenome TaxID=652676 RepID=A0A3B0ZDV3_9ZZZZ
MAKVMSKAVILLSGGLDSVTALAIAQSQGYQCHALSFDYGQRHRSELDAVKRILVRFTDVTHKVIHLDLDQIGGSALTDDDIAVPILPSEGIPVTYVPARNTIFLSLALGWAEVLSAEAIFIGVNAVDYSGYPDCRPEYIESFQSLANLATRQAVEGKAIKLETPLIHLSKAEIIKKGLQLGVDYSLTVSCYAADVEGRACGECDSCRLRAAGFADAGISDPTIYQ